MIPKIPKQVEIAQKAKELVEAGHSVQQISLMLNTTYRHVPLQKRRELITAALQKIVNAMRKELEARQNAGTETGTN